MTKLETVQRTQSDLFSLGIDENTLAVLIQEYSFTNQWLRNDAYKVGYIFRENGSKIKYVILYYSSDARAWVILGETGKLKTKDTKWLSAYNTLWYNTTEAKKIIDIGLKKYLSMNKIK